MPGTGAKKGPLVVGRRSVFYPPAPFTIVTECYNCNFFFVNFNFYHIFAVGIPTITKYQPLNQKKHEK